METSAIQIFISLHTQTDRKKVVVTLECLVILSCKILYLNKKRKIGILVWMDPFYASECRIIINNYVIYKTPHYGKMMGTLQLRQNSALFCRKNRKEPTSVQVTVKRIKFKWQQTGQKLKGVLLILMKISVYTKYKVNGSRSICEVSSNFKKCVGKEYM